MEDVNNLAFLSPVGNELYSKLRRENIVGSEAKRIVDSRRVELTENDQLYLSYIQAIRNEDNLARKNISRELLESSDGFLRGIGIAEVSRDAHNVLEDALRELTVCRQNLQVIAERFSEAAPPPNIIMGSWLFLALDAVAIVEAIATPMAKRGPEIAIHFDRLEDILINDPDFLRFSRAFLVPNELENLH